MSSADEEVFTIAEDVLGRLNSFVVSPHTSDRVRERVAYLKDAPDHVVLHEIHEALKNAHVAAYEASYKPVCNVRFHPHGTLAGAVELYAVVDIKPDNVGVVCTILTGEMFRQKLLEGIYYREEQKKKH